VGRVPRPLNTFETKAMICDLAGENGGQRKGKKMIQS
jgi:DNA helicase-2/ATP-dependent DNA helicase PcrA